MAGPELLLAAAAVQAVGAISQANTESKNLKSQAAAYDANATIQRNNAARVAREASLKEDAVRRQTALFLGRQRAAQAEAGTLGTGSGLDIQEDSYAQAELDALTVRYEGATQRRAYLQDADMLNYQAANARSNAKAVKRQGYMSAVGSMLGGAGRYYQAQSMIPQTPTNTVNVPSGNLPWQRPGNVRPQWAGGGYY